MYTAAYYGEVLFFFFWVLECGYLLKIVGAWVHKLSVSSVWDAVMLGIAVFYPRNKFMQVEASELVGCFFERLVQKAGDCLLGQWLGCSGDCFLKGHQEIVEAEAIVSQNS